MSNHMAMIEQRGDSRSADRHPDRLSCPACLAGHMQIFCTIEDVPTNSCLLLATEEEARAYPTGEIRLGFCGDCGFIGNTAFEEVKTEYSGRYEETQGFSGTFNKFHKDLAQRLIDKYGLHEKRILEIGCGKGEFLILLSELGQNYGIGIDPGVDFKRLSGKTSDKLTFIADFYSEKYADQAVDFLVCKMTLEHIPSAAEFVTDVRKGLGTQTGAIVFFQIPEAQRILQDVAFEDIYYEHCSYYSAGSLARLFRRAGFHVLDLAVEYGGQYLTVEARPASPSTSPSPPLGEEDDLADLAGLVATFPQRWAEKIEHWRARLNAFRQAGKTIALWGSGSKAVSFITTLRLDGHIQYVTDINPYRHGHFMPKTAQKILSPAQLAERKPDVVIAMNPIYREEIGRDLERLNLDCELLTL